MRFITRNSTLKLLLKGAKSPSKDEDVKIYWFPSLVHNVWTIGENFNDFKDFKDFDDFKDSAELFRQIRSPKKTSRTFLQKHWTFSKKRGRFSQKRWTFSEKRWTFSKKSPTFFVLYPCFFVLELWWNNPLVWRLWKQKVQNPCNVRAWYAHARARNQRCIWTCSSSSEEDVISYYCFFILGSSEFSKFLWRYSSDDMYPFWRFWVHVLMICTRFGVFGYTFWWYVPV